MSLTNDTTMLVQPAYGCNSGGGFGDMFGGNGAWWIVLFLIFGWGRNGFGGGNDGMNGCIGSEVQRGFDHSSVVTKLDGITQGLCDGFYAVNSGLSNGFNATQVAIMQGNNALQAQIAQCCCDTREAISGVRYDLATQACETRNVIQNATRDILENNNANARAILDAQNQNYIRSLENENQSLKLAASQSAQNAYLAATIDAANATLIRRLGIDCPQPAYLVNAPTPVSFPTNACGQVSFANSGCGGCGF